MRARQYVYFVVFSKTMTAGQMTERVGLAPDEAVVRGSGRTEPNMVPVEHGWKVRCDELGMRVDDQIARVLARLLPYQDRIGALISDPAAACGATLQVVRYLEDEDDERGGSTEPDQGLGWHLDRDVFTFLIAVGAELDVDEYG